MEKTKTKTKLLKDINQVGNTTTVTILGKEVKLKYSFNTEVCFYKITGKSIEKLDSENPADLVALFLSCEMAAIGSRADDTDVPLDSSALLDDASSTELLKAFEACILLRAAWYQQPEEVKDEPKTESGKN